MTISNITFDPIANAMYVMIRDNKVHKSVRYEDGVVVDYDYKGGLVGIEFLNATKRSIEVAAKKFHLNLLMKKASPISRLLEPV